MFRLLSHFRNRANRLRYGRALAFVAATLLILPSFACRCADGRLKPFCLPGRCLSCVQLTSSHSCCSHKRCCGSAHSNSRCGSPSAQSTVKKIPCCRLVVGAPTPAIVSVAFDMGCLPLIDCWLSDRYVSGLTAVDVANRQQAAVDTSPPPLDLVIAQSRLTI
jgi:hypothetical protein